MDSINYWYECIALAADDWEIRLTEEQITSLAEAVQDAHDYYEVLKALNYKKEN